MLYINSLNFKNFPQIDVFFKSLLLYYLFYKIVNRCLQKNDQYNKLSLDRKNYFLKNIVKSIVLLYISSIGTYMIYNGYVMKIWKNRLFYQVGYQYAALDILGLIMVRKLPINSKIHHISSFILAYLNTRVNYEKRTFWIGLPIYCLLSCYAFTVNLFLALRLVKSLKELKILIDLCYYSYGLLLGINWSYQLYVVYNYFEVSFGLTFYVSLILFVANDDIKLMRFLKYHKNKAKEC